MDRTDSNATGRDSKASQVSTQGSIVKVRLGDAVAPWPAEPKVRLGDAVMPWLPTGNR